MGHVLLRTDVLQHLFGRLRADFKNKLEYDKWSCVCRTWQQAENQWCAFAEAIVEDFKMRGHTPNKKEFMKDGGIQVMQTVLAKYSDNPVVREFTSAALDNMRT